VGFDHLPGPYACDANFSWVSASNHPMN